MPVMMHQYAMVFPKVCDITLGTITLRCPRPPLQADTFVELPERLAGGEYCLLFKPAPMPKARMRSFLFCVTTDNAQFLISGRFFFLL